MVESSAWSREKSSIAALVFGVGVVVGCGQTRNVLEHNSGSQDGEAGEGAAQAAQGGSSSGGVKGSGMPSSAAGNAGSGAAFTGAGGRVATWDSRQCHATPVAEPTEPSLRARWTRARDFCTTLGAHDCFRTGVIMTSLACTAGQMIDDCMAQALWFHDEYIAPECEDAWSKVFECGASSGSAAGLCTQTSLYGLAMAPPATCAAENAAVRECWEQYKPSDGVEVTGSYAKCYYANGPSSCTVRCPVGEQTATLACQGKNGSPMQCACHINDHAVNAYDAVFVNDCAEAGQQAANGLCSSLLDCCFEYADGAKQSCMCTDPARFGYSSCEAMMAVAAGKKVDICPELLPNPPSAPEGGCWPPGGCEPSGSPPNTPP